MRRQGKELIDYLCKERSAPGENTQSLANSIDSSVEHLGNGSVINELLQNADDAGASQIRFELTTNYLLVTHDGKPFNEQDVKAIADAANKNRDKLTDLEQIGHKGIGFKTVFTVADQVIVQSPGYCFAFDRNYWSDPSALPWQICPIWRELEQLDSEIRPLLQQDKVQFFLRILPERRSSIIEQLSQIQSTHFIFLRHLKQCDIKFHAGNVRHLSLSSPKVNEGVSEIRIDEDSSWLLYQSECSVSPELSKALSNEKQVAAKYRELQSILVTLAVRKEGDRLVPIEGTPQIFCYLPCDEDLGLHFVVNADFMLDMTRATLPKRGIAGQWNAMILRHVYFTQFQFLQLLAQRLKLTSSIVAILSEPVAKAADMKRELDKAFSQGLAEAPLFFDMEKAKLHLCQDLLYDHTEFAQQFANSEERRRCFHPDYSEWLRNMTFKGSSYVRKSYDENEIASALENRLVEGLCKERTNAGFVRWCIQWLSTFKGSKDRLTNVVKNTSLFLSANKELCKLQDLKFTEESLKYAIAVFSDIRLVHPQIAALADCQMWLTAMGVTPVVFSDLITQVNNDRKKNIQMTLGFARLKHKFTDEHMKLLPSLKVMNAEGQLVPANQAFIPRRFASAGSLVQLIEPNDKALHPDYFLQESSVASLIDFFKSLGVADQLTTYNFSTAIAAVSQSGANEKYVALALMAVELWRQISDDKDKKTLIIRAKKLLVKTQSDDYVIPTNCYFADCYDPEEKLQSHVPDLPYLADDYLKSLQDRALIREFFKELGVVERIDVRPASSKKRTELEATVEGASDYFAYLEKAYHRNLMPCGSYSYKHQHTLEPGFVVIDLFSSIAESSYFWTLVSKHWSTIENYLNVRYVTWKSSYPVESNFRWLVRRAVERASESGKLTSDFFCNSLVDQLVQYGHGLPTLPAASVLTVEQRQQLGFQNHLSLEKCLQVLTDMAKHNDAQEKIVKLVLQHLLPHLTAEKHCDRPFSLLSAARSYTVSSELLYIEGEPLSLSSSPFLIRRPRGIKPADFVKICRYFNVKVMAASELQPVASGSRDNVLPDKLRQQLAYVAAMEISHLRQPETEWSATFARIQQQLHLLSFQAVENVRVRATDHIEERVSFWLDQNSSCLFYTDFAALSLGEQMELYQCLRDFLQLSIAKSIFADCMTMPLSRLLGKYDAALSEAMLEFCNGLLTAETESMSEDSNSRCKRQRLEEVAETSAYTNQSSSSTLPLAERKAIGYAGEKAVFSYLLDKHKKKHGEGAVQKLTESSYRIQKLNYLKRVEWLNASEESFKPYDFEVTVEKDSTTVVRHLEVKSTRFQGLQPHHSLSARETKTAYYDERRSPGSYRLYSVQLDSEGSPISSPSKFLLFKAIAEGHLSVEDSGPLTLKAHKR